MAQPPPVRLFIGSSTEGLPVARNLQAELQSMKVCEVERWDQNVFAPSSYPLDSLVGVAARVDFAVLVASPDDVTHSREQVHASVRDNVILEFGLFAGAIGRERTYLLVTGPSRLPSDTLGLTTLPFHPQSDGKLRASVTAAALEIQGQVERHGRLSRLALAPGSDESEQAALDREIDLLCASAIAQGWTVRTNNQTTLRFRTPKGRSHALAKSKPRDTRVLLRQFAGTLRAGGLRVNSAVRRPVSESPF